MASEGCGKMSAHENKMSAVPETTKFQFTWVLWYFDPRNKDWSLTNYKKIADLSTPQQFWTVLNAIPAECWECGYFFFIRKGFRPIWEVPENEQGGSWSKKIPTSKIYDIATELMVYAASGHLLTRPELLVGFSTSPKGEHNVIKIWNTTSTQNSKLLLNQTMKEFPISDDVTYTPHRARKY